MNRIEILGRLTSDPELRQSQSGVASCRFTVAVNRNFKNDKGEYDADFISCVAFKKTAEFICKFWSKGKMIAVDGSLRTGSYNDRNHPNIKHYTADVFVDNAYFCGDKAERQSPSYPPTDEPTSEPQMNYGNISDFEDILSEGDVPF